MTASWQEPYPCGSVDLFLARVELIQTRKFCALSSPATLCVNILLTTYYMWLQAASEPSQFLLVAGEDGLRCEAGRAHLLQKQHELPHAC